MRLPSRAPVLLAGALLLAAAPSAAQEARPGERVRVASPAARGTFALRGVRGDSLVLATLADSSAVVVPLSSVERMDVRRSRSRGRGALRGAGLGVAFGAATGFLMGVADGDDEDGFLSFSAEEKGALGAAVLGLAGGVGGLVVGAVAPGSRWVRVDPPSGPRVGVAPGGGGVTVSLSLPVGGGAGP